MKSDMEICDLLSTLCPVDMPYCSKSKFEGFKKLVFLDLNFDEITDSKHIDVSALFNAAFGIVERGHAYLEVVQAWNCLFCQAEVLLDEFMSNLSIEGLESNELMKAQEDINPEKWSSVAIWQLMRSRQTESGRKILSIAQLKSTKILENDDLFESYPIAFRTRGCNPVINQLDNFLQTIKNSSLQRDSKSMRASSGFVGYSVQGSMLDSNFENSQILIEHLPGTSWKKVAFNAENVAKLHALTFKLEGNLLDFKESYLRLKTLKLPSADLDFYEFRMFFKENFLEITEERNDLEDIILILFSLMLDEASAKLTPGRAVLACLLPAKASLLDKVRFCSKLVSTTSHDLLSALTDSDTSDRLLAASLQASGSQADQGCAALISLLQLDC